MRPPRALAVLMSVAAVAGCTVTREEAVAPAPPPVQSLPQGRPKMLMRLGDDLARSGDEAGALAMYRAALTAAPRDPQVLERMGTAFLALGDGPRAEQAFRGALAIAPGEPGAERGLGLALLAEGEAAAALPILAELATRSPDPRLLGAEGTALEMTGHPRQAQAAFRRGLEEAPTDADLHADLALSLALSGEAESALGEMQAALAAPEPDPRLAGNAVLVLALAGREEEARARGDATIGAAETEAVLGRAEEVMALADARMRAEAVGLLMTGRAQEDSLAARLLPAAGGTALDPPVTGRHRLPPAAGQASAPASTTPTSTTMSPASPPMTSPSPPAPLR